MQKFANFCRARSRLYQNEIMQRNMRLTAFLKLYKMCTLLHRSKLNILDYFSKKSIHALREQIPEVTLLVGLLQHLADVLRPRLHPACLSCWSARKKSLWALFRAARRNICGVQRSAGLTNFGRKIGVLPCFQMYN